MSVPRQGEIWWAEADDKRRPVLVVTRDVAVPTLGWIVVAPVTRTVRGIPTEIPLGPEQGLRWECAASFDNLQTIRRSFLTAVAAPTTPDRPRLIRAALSALANC